MVQHAVGKVNGALHSLQETGQKFVIVGVRWSNGDQEGVVRQRARDNTRGPPRNDPRPEEKSRDHRAEGASLENGSALLVRLTCPLRKHVDNANPLIMPL